MFRLKKSIKNKEKIKTDGCVDLTLNTGPGIFNHRVAAVILQNNSLLAQKNTKTGAYYLVGGRIRFGESSREALVREVREELAITVTDFLPLWINECFFIDEGKKFHEVGMYYLVDIHSTNFNNYETVFKTQEKNRTNTFEWLDITKLDKVKLYPEFIKEEIKYAGKNLKLIITREVE